MEHGPDIIDAAPTLDVSKIGVLSVLTALGRLGRSLTIIVLPLFALEIGYDEAFYGLMVAAAGYVQAAALFPAGTFSDRRGRGLAILLGSIISGIGLVLIPFTSDPILIIGLYALTGLGGGFTSTSIDSLIADHTRSGGERTKSYGYTITVATLAAIVGPFMGGYILDPVAFPGIDNAMVRYAIIFTFMGVIMFAAGIIGFTTDRWLKNNTDDSKQIEAKEEGTETFTAENDAKTALLFGASQGMMGFASGMVIPYLIPWIYAAFNPDPVVLGSIPAIANLTLASGTLFVGLGSERIGKLRIIFLLYLLSPVFMLGIVYSWSLETILNGLGIAAPAFFVMIVFYIARNAVANMARPAYSSLFMGEISVARRARSLALTRISWTFLRQSGTLVTAVILALSVDIVTFGLVLFPIAMVVYPLCVIPMYFAVKRNERVRQTQQESLRQVNRDRSEAHI
ncbi:MAG: MFS transporter [Candidatus Thorarchaeota archaeon]|nr:MAG: MFS transporter [Candidatus Thorarchaeota archaeon]